VGTFETTFLDANFVDYFNYFNFHLFDKCVIIFTPVLLPYFVFNLIRLGKKYVFLHVAEANFNEGTTYTLLSSFSTTFLTFSSFGSYVILAKGMAVFI